MLSCFTDDVWAIFQGNDLGRGRDKILAYINTAACGFPHRVVDPHARATCTSKSTATRATADTYGIGYLVFDAGAGPTLRTRHLHYIDDLVRIGRRVVADREAHLDQRLGTVHPVDTM